MSYQPLTDENNPANKIESLGEVQKTLEDNLNQMQQQVLDRELPWKNYYKGLMMAQEDLELLVAYDKKPKPEKQRLMKESGTVYAQLFLKLLTKIKKNETLQYILTLIDEILTISPESVDDFLGLQDQTPNYPYEPFTKFDNSDLYINAKVGSILCHFFKRDQSNTKYILWMAEWIINELKSEPNNNEKIWNAINILQNMASQGTDRFKLDFVEKDGLQLLSGLLVEKFKSFQLLYQVIFCVWCLTFNKKIAEKVNTTSLIPNLAGVLRTNISREKIVRITVHALANLVNKSTNNEKMIESRLMPLLELLESKQIPDEEVENDLDELIESLKHNFVILSSIEMYRKELIEASELTWTPVHKSEKFFRENGHHFEEDNLKLLVRLKERLSSKNATTICVACSDIGEFGRLYNRGRSALAKVDMKTPLLALMNDSKQDPEVRKQALIAIQKIMVTNWEYLVQKE